jgi:TM2 domain-containing membrane protein YozV
MNRKLFQLIPSLSEDEAQMLTVVTQNLDDDKLMTFASIYNGKRQKADTILITTILGFFGIAGIQRFILKQVGMGLLYLFTGGLCYIGTIIDLINYRKLTLDYNEQAAHESIQIANALR